MIIISAAHENNNSSSNAPPSTTIPGVDSSQEPDNPPGIISIINQIT